MAGGHTMTARPQRMRFRWAADPDGTMPMTTFLATLSRLRGALYYTALDPDDPRDLDVKVRLVHVEHSKGKEFSAVADVSVSNGHVVPGVGAELVRNLGRFRSAKPSAGPPIRDMDTLNAYQRLTEPLQRDADRKITIAAGGHSIAITKRY